MLLQFWGGFVFRKEKKELIKYPLHLTTLVTDILAVHELVCVDAWERAGMSVYRKEGETWERGLYVEIAMDQLKHNIGLIF